MDVIEKLLLGISLIGGTYLFAIYVSTIAFSISYRYKLRPWFETRGYKFNYFNLPINILLMKVNGDWNKFLYKYGLRKHLKGNL